MNSKIANIQVNQLNNFECTIKIYKDLNFYHFVINNSNFDEGIQSCIKQKNRNN